MLDIEHVTIQLGQTRAVDDLSLSLEEGKIIGLLGPNGAGKTTLIRMIMGLQKPKEGTITLFGQYRPGAFEARERIGYMPQQLAVYEGLTVHENLLFYGRMYGVDPTELLVRAHEIIERVELDEWRNEPVANLSGGMVRRTMLATAMIHKPKLLILDEPTAGVDPLLRLRFWEWFEQLVDEGTSIIVTTHNIAEAANCHQSVFMRQGKILENSTPDQLVAKYGSKNLEEAFVAAVHRQSEIDTEQQI